MNMQTFCDRIKAIQDSYFNNLNQLHQDHLRVVDELHSSVKQEIGEVFNDFTGGSPEPALTFKEYKG